MLIRRLGFSLLPLSLLVLAFQSRAQAETASAPTIAAKLDEIAAADAANKACPAPTQLPPVRSGGGITVESPPRPHDGASFALRLRSQVGVYTQSHGSVPLWHGPEVPTFVPLETTNGSLAVVEERGGVYMALYRGSKGCEIDPKGPLTFKNCPSEARLWDCRGKEIASVPLHPLHPRGDHIEVQDAHFDKGTLYFNEACQTYSRDAKGRCSSLVAYDPSAKKVLWRTPSLTSNNWFVVRGDYIVSAYGFTGEPANVRIIRKKDGAIVDTHSLPGTNFEMFAHGDVLSIECWSTHGRSNFRMTGWDGPTPKLVRLASTPDPSESRNLPPKNERPVPPSAVPTPKPTFF